MMRASVFRRSPLLLLAAALMALAVFLAPGAQPARAQTDTVWSGTLTVKELGSERGCHNARQNKRCSDTDVLTSYQFTHGGTRYSIREISHATDYDEMIFNVGVVGAAVDDLTLRIGAASFPLKDATHGSGSNANDHIWSNAGLSWSEGDTVELSLTAPLPTVSLSASATTVREGTSVTVTATLSRSRGSETVVPVTLHASSTEDGDHGALTSITIPANSATGTGVITTTMDSDTDDEVFHVGLDNAAKDAGYVWGAVTWLDITILDSDLRQVSLSVSPNPVDEAQLTTVTVTLTSLRWGTPASLGSDVTIPLTFTAGSAESDDYTDFSSVPIAAGSTTNTASGIIISDDTDSDDETFTVALDTANAAWPSGVKAGAVSSVQVRITDDDAASPGTLSVDTGFGNPECGATITVTSETPEWALVLSPAPAAEERTQYRVLADSNGKWLGAVPVRTTGSSAFTSFKSYAELMKTSRGFRGFEFRLDDHPDVTASCTWTFQTGGV